MLTEGNPDYAFAYKQKRDGVETTVTGVELTIGRTGKVCGVIHIDPVQVDGITATKATIKSADFILTGYCNPPRPINVGARVLVERSGVVIPNVASVVEGASEPAMPPFAIELRGADWYVTEKHVWQYAAELAAWFALTSDGLGESAATLLATDEQSTLLQVLAGKAVFPHQHQMDSYVNWLAAVKQLPLSRLMAAHGPFTGIGVVRTANLITKVPALRRGFRFQWEPAQQAHVLLYPEGMVKLNQSAGEILKRCDGQRDVAAIVADLEATFNATGLGPDVEAFLTMAEAQNWIVWNPA